MWLCVCVNTLIAVTGTPGTGKTTIFYYFGREARCRWSPFVIASGWCAQRLLGWACCPLFSHVPASYLAHPLEHPRSRRLNAITNCGMLHSLSPNVPSGAAAAASVAAAIHRLAARVLLQQQSGLLQHEDRRHAARRSQQLRGSAHGPRHLVGRQGYNPPHVVVVHCAGHALTAIVWCCCLQVHRRCYAARRRWFARAMG